MPKSKNFLLDKYDLNESFVSKNGFNYFKNADPTDHLIAWFRFEEDQVLDDSSSGNHAAELSGVKSFVDASPFDRRKIGNLRKTLAGASPQLSVSEDGDFTFGDAQHGASDSAYTMHWWVKTKLFSQNVTLCSKLNGSDTVILVRTFSGTFSWTQGQGSNNVTKSLSLNSSYDDEWTHIAITYAGLSASEMGNATAQAAMKVYVNGKRQSTSDTATGSGYGGMDGTNQKLNLSGFNGPYDNGNAASGGLQEFGVWSGKALSAEEVAALYDAQSGFIETGKIKERLTISGITSLPIKPFVSDLDNMTGSYPTIARNTSPSGRYSTQFDDNDVIVFFNSGSGASMVGAGSKVVLGQKLLQGSKYSGSLVVAPNTLPDLLGGSDINSVRAGVGDSRVTFTPGQDYKPFVEDHLYAADKKSSGFDPFYATGSQIEDVGAGFSSPLWSKTKIVIDLNPGIQTKICFSTGTDQKSSPYNNRGEGIQEGVNSGITYFNFDRRAFEIIGDTITGSNVDYFSNSPEQRSGSMLAFAPSMPITDATIQQGSGFPTTFAGFPFDKKFNATGSQLYSLEDQISTPFLLEKMVYEFSGSMPFLSTGISRANIMQFFILNQRAYDIPARKIDVSWRNSRNSAHPGMGTVTGSFVVDKIRDIVNVAQVSLYNSTAAAADIKTLGYARDLNLEFDSIATAPTGTFVLSSSVETPTISYGLGALLGGRNLSNSNGSAILKNEFGGRTNLANAPNGLVSSPRSYVNNTAGRVVKSTFNFSSADYLTLEIAENNSLPSPYLLMPKDKLIFGWANQQQPTRGSTSQSEQEVAGLGGGFGNEDGSFFISPGAGKLVLYGSSLRNHQEFHHGLNQLLTSDAVHEDVRDNSTMTNTSDCLDQFYNEYNLAYTGSYIDNALGDFNVRSVGDPATRIDGHVHSVVQGQAGTTGSIVRAIRLSDSNERILDTLVPDPAAIASANQNNFRVDDGQIEPADLAPNLFPMVFYPLGSPLEGAGSSSPANPDDIWPKSFPFDERYGGSDAPRIGAPPSSAEARKDLDGVDVGNIEAPGLSVILNNIQDHKTGPKISFIGKLDASGASLYMPHPVPNQRRAFFRAFYGFGKNPDGLPVLHTPSDRSDKAAGDGPFEAVAHNSVRISGFKYGLLNAFPQYTACIFRHDRYGQFRDMLEQRKLYQIDRFTKTLDPFQPGNSRSEQIGGQGFLKNSPVTAKFIKTVTDPLGNSARKQNFSIPQDFDNVKAVLAGNLRGLWNSSCNIDVFARSARPFFDQAPLTTTGGSSVANIGIEDYQADLLNNFNGPATFDFSGITLS